MHIHVKECPFLQKNTNSETKRDRSLIVRSELIRPIGQNDAGKSNECILSKMMEGEVFKIIRSDQLILLFGETEYKTLGTTKDSKSPSRYQFFRKEVFKVAGYNLRKNSF